MTPIDIAEFIKKYHDEINAITAVAALLVSFLSIIFTVVALRIQRSHNFKSLTPVAFISIGDYEDRLTIKIKNHGVGPLMIKQLKVFKEEKQYSAVVDCMPRGISWQTFTGDVSGWWLAAGSEITLLNLTGNYKNKAFQQRRDACRLALSQLRIEIHYADVYNRKMPVSERGLDWFGRNLKKIKKKES